MITEPHYRDMILLDTKLTPKEFEKNMHIDRYIIINAKSHNNDKDISSFYLLHNNNNMIRKLPEFRKIINKVTKNIKFIYFISDKKFSPQVLKSVIVLQEQNIFKVRLYSHEIFTFEVPKHTRCF